MTLVTPFYIIYPASSFGGIDSIKISIPRTPGKGLFTLACAGGDVKPKSELRTSNLHSSPGELSYPTVISSFSSPAPLLSQAPTIPRCRRSEDGVSEFKVPSHRYHRHGVKCRQRCVVRLEVRELSGHAPCEGLLNGGCLWSAHCSNPLAVKFQVPVKLLSCFFHGLKGV